MATLKDQIARWNRSTKKQVGSASAPGPALATAEPPATTQVPVQSHVAEPQTPPAPAPAIKTKTSQGVDYYGTKTKLHQKLLERIDLDSIESLTSDQLRNELGAFYFARYMLTTKEFRDYWCMQPQINDRYPGSPPVRNRGEMFLGT